MSQPYAANQPTQQQEDGPTGQVHRHIPKLTAAARNKTLMYLINSGQNAAQAKRKADFQRKSTR